MHLYYPLRDANGDLVQNEDGSVAVVKDADGNPLKVQDDYISETWEAPKDCVARDYKGDPLTTGKDQLALPPAGSHFQCVEAPMTGFQAVPSDTTPGNFGQTVNGNYAFADMNYDPDALAAEATRQGEALKNGDDTQGCRGQHPHQAGRPRAAAQRRRLRRQGRLGQGRLGQGHLQAHRRGGRQRLRR